MLKKKLTDKSLCGVLVLLGIVILLIVYFVPVKNLETQISSLESENESIRSHLASLQEYYDNRAQYEADTVILRDEIANIASSFPSMYRIEDYILEGIDIENAVDTTDLTELTEKQEPSDLTYTSISVADPDVLTTVDSDTVKQANIDEYQNAMTFYEQSVSYNGSIDYDGLKEAVAEIFASDYRANIQNITFNVNTENGNLDGVFVLGYYFIDGNGVEYVEPEIPEYVAGTDNIFGHYTVIEEDSDDATDSSVE